MLKTILLLLAVLVVLIVLAAAWARWNFDRMVFNELEVFLPRHEPAAAPLTLEQITHLPAPVQRWLQRSGAVGRPPVRLAYLHQTGQMLTKPGGSWLPVTSRQYFRTAEPGFIWVADVKMAPLLHMAGRDMYQDGHGAMVIKLASLLPVVNARGPETDQGTMLRYLAETVWFPSAVLHPSITWESVDSTSARATMSYGGITASGLFTFTAEGDFDSFEAQRYYYRKEGSTLEPWLVRVEKDGYQEFDGMRLPARCTVTWRFKEGEFTWYRLQIEQVTYE